MREAPRPCPAAAATAPSPAARCGSRSPTRCATRCSPGGCSRPGVHGQGDRRAVRRLRDPGPRGAGRPLRAGAPGRRPAPRLPRPRVLRRRLPRHDGGPQPGHRRHVPALADGHRRLHDRRPPYGPAVAVRRRGEEAARAAVAGDLNVLIGYDLRFWRELSALFGNPYLSDFLHRLRVQTWVCAVQHLRGLADLRGSLWSGHTELADALPARHRDRPQDPHRLQRPLSDPHRAAHRRLSASRTGKGPAPGPCDSETTAIRLPHDGIPPGAPPTTLP